MSSENPFITKTVTNWALCCLCQGQSRTDLRYPYSKECYHSAYHTLEKDLLGFVSNDIPLPLGVNPQNLDDGSGIANTLLANKASYHNGCRVLFRPAMLQREQRKRDKPKTEEATISPKKTRLSFNAKLDRKIPQCVYCEKLQTDGEEQIYRARSNDCGKNLLAWAIESRNWVVHARLNTAINAEDAEAADIHYHSSCYTKLKNAARAAKSQSSAESSKSTTMQGYDPLVFAHLVAFVRFSQSPLKMSQLRKLYRQRLETLGSDWMGVNIHPTRFKEHLLNKLGPDWVAFQQGREVYISNKQTVGAVLAATAQLQVTDDEAQKIVDVGIMLRKYVLLQQSPFDGSFRQNCLSEPVAKPLLTLIDILLEGSRSICNSGRYDKSLFRADNILCCH